MAKWLEVCNICADKILLCVYLFSLSLSLFRVSASFSYHALKFLQIFLKQKFVSIENIDEH